MHSSVLPTFSSIRFSVVGFMLRSLIDLDLSFEHGDRYGSTFILLHVDIQLCQHHLLNMLSFFHVIFFCFFVKNQMFIGMWIKYPGLQFCSIGPPVCFMVIPGCFQSCSSVVEFKIRDCDAFRSSFIVQDCFGYSGFFCFFI